MSKTEIQNIKEWYASQFSEYESKLNGQTKTFLHDLRKDALSKLNEMNFPTLKDEEWRYTNVSPILKHNFVHPLSVEKVEYTKDEISKYIFNGFDSHLVVIINGIFSEELSDIKNLPEGVVIGSLDKISRENPELIKNHFGKNIKLKNAFNFLNAAYSNDGLVLYVPNNKVLEKPIQVLYLNGNDNAEVLSVPRSFIYIGKSAEASVIANYRGMGKNPYLSNVINEFVIEQNAHLNYYKVQNESQNAYHIDLTDGYQNRDSVFNHLSLSFGGLIVRNDLASLHDDENIQTHYYGLYVGRQNQHIDNYTFVDHAKPNCESNELYKGILDDKARGVFTGRILVRQDAQKTNAYQSNKAVLLSEKTQVDTKPQLEIFADDVKCSHGAAIGRLDDVAYFYIRSRGVPEAIAKSMLIKAYASDVLDNVTIEEFKEQLNHMIFESLHRVEVE